MRLSVWRASTFAAFLACVAGLYQTIAMLAAAKDLSVTVPLPQEATVSLRAPGIPRTTVDIWEAVDVDPFREDRAPGIVRYRLPGAPADSEEVRNFELSPAVTLLGTVVSADGTGFALCQSGDEPPRLLRPGQTIGGLTLQRVEQAKATFAAVDGRLSTLIVPPSGPP
jgi:hypothetical protein